jgi:hypothetical protein
MHDRDDTTTTPIPRAGARFRAREGADGESVVFAVCGPDLDDFRTMLREQIAGDSEQLRFIREHGQGRRSTDATHLTVDRVRRRLDFLWRLADHVGGVY